MGGLLTFLLMETENINIGQSVRLIKRITSDCLSLPLIMKNDWRILNYEKKEK